MNPSALTHLLEDCKMIRKLILGTAATLGLVASTAFGTTSDDGPRSLGRPESLTVHAEAKVDLWVVWYFEYGRWRGIGPLNYYDANTTLANLQRRGYRAYIATP
jgi:hypothetical protein